MCRFANTDDLDAYLGEASDGGPFEIVSQAKGSSDTEADIIGRGEAFEESLFLGLRLNEGVVLDSLRGEFGDAMLAEAMPALMEVRRRWSAASSTSTGYVLQRADVWSPTKSSAAY